MRRKGWIGASFAGATLVGISAFVMLPLISIGEMNPPPASEPELPYPYCLPDAQPPASPSPLLPPRPAESFGPFNPLADALVAVGGIDSFGPPDETMQLAQIDIDEVLWQTAFPGPYDLQEYPVPVDTVVVLGAQDVWIEASEATQTGATVILALGFNGAEGYDYQLYYGLEVTAGEPTVLAPEPLGTIDTAQFRAFLSWEGNPLGQDPVTVLEAWNIEADGPWDRDPIRGPIALSFDQFLETQRGPTYPIVGSTEWWAKAPPLCRSMLDAPTSVTDPLDVGTAWVHIPASWREVSGASVCLRISLGSMGCADPSTTTAQYEYLFWDQVFALPGEPIQVQIALLKGDSPSWVERVTIGTFSVAQLLESGSVLVELDPLYTPGSYQGVLDHPNASTLATARPLSAAEAEEFHLNMPEAPGRSCSQPC